MIGRALLVVAALGLGPTELSGQEPATSTLAFTPASPLLGAEVQVEYRGSPPAGTERLVLRARYRTRVSSAYNYPVNLRMQQTRVTELEPAGAGAFRASIRLPPDVVYAAFAVESLGAEWADDNRGRPWELVVHGGDGRPLPAALEQRFNDYMGRDLREVVGSARTATEHYPQSASAWDMLGAAEGWAAGASRAEEVEEQNRARAERLSEGLRGRADLTGDDIAELMQLTRGSPASAEWRERLDREHPDHPMLLVERVSEVRTEHKDRPADLLRAYDSIWVEMETHAGHSFFFEQVRSSLAATALGVATREGSPEQQAAWVRRAEAVVAPVNLMLTSLRTPSLREEAIPRAIGYARRSQSLPDDERLLGETLAGQRTRSGVIAGRLLIEAGRALLQTGDTAAAVETLEEAARVSPGEATLRDLGNALLASGDTARAVQVWASVAGHLDAPAALADSMRARMGTHFDPSLWSRSVSEARTAVVERMLERAVTMPLPSLDLMGPDGVVRPLEEVRAGAPATVVIFVSRFCGPSMHAMPLIQELSREVTGAGVAVLPITADERSEAFQQTFRDAGIEIPIYHDVTGDAALAFNVWGTPTYFVLDGRGVVRFTQTSLASLRLQLEALRTER